MKNKMSILLLLSVFLLGLAIVLYPLVSNYLNSKTQSRAISSYGNAVAAAKTADYSRLFAAADAYNESLRDLAFPLTDYEQLEGYRQMLALEGSNVMARISIEKIDVDLPVCHGSSEAVLSIAAGHLQGSSLPVGGAGTHAVLTAHRGLPSARLFSDLNRLEAEDIFQISVLDRKLLYRVEEIVTVKPDETDRLRIVPGEDYCTLFTCTPYGINTHRLLVRGKRLADGESGVIEDEVITSSRKYDVDFLPALTLVFAAVLMARLTALLVKYKRREIKK